MEEPKNSPSMDLEINPPSLNDPTCDETVGEYVDEVTNSVENQVHEAVLEKEKKRKLFLFELMKHLGRQVVSFDALDFYRASFLLEKDDFVCLLDVKLPPEFPGRPPCYRLLSVYVKNITHTNIPLPFNDKWDISTMVEQALHLIKSKYMDKIRDDTVAAFQIPK